MMNGSYTALVTPMTDDDARTIDYDALSRLIDFQVDQGITGVLAMGTTGESPTTDWDEHCRVIAETNRLVAGRCTVIAGTGSNCTGEAMAHTRHAVEAGVRYILLVEPYYNGPSSIEIRREYMAPVAAEFPEAEIIPYVIPGRSGCQILPEDVALMAHGLPNVNAVKEATGNLHNMRRTRELCGDNFAILSGDDPLSLTMITDKSIGCSGCISVWSNVAPGAVSGMVAAALAGDTEEADRLNSALQPLFDIVTVKTQEDSPWGLRECKARNPMAVKTLMRLLGMPVGPCRQPLGRMTPKGLQVVIDAASQVWRASPEILTPVAETFGVDIEKRLSDPAYRAGLVYED